MPSPTPEPDHSAFLNLYAEHQGALQTFVRSLLSSRKETAEVMQEVPVVLHRIRQALLECVQRGVSREGLA